MPPGQLVPPLAVPSVSVASGPPSLALDRRREHRADLIFRD